MPPHAPTLDDLLSHPALAWDEWAISKVLAEALWQRLDERRPRRLLELGSGTSTAVLAAYAARHGAAVITLEHEPAYHAQTAAMLEALGLRSAVDLRRAPCAPRHFDHRRYACYDTTLSGTFDFVFVDGPPLQLGREAALFAVWPHLAEGWELWLKDGARAHEQACLARWKEHFALAHHLDRTDPRGVLIVQAATPAPAATSPAPPQQAASEAPLVSCIMPTHNRRRYVPLALHYFLQQDYPNRELLVLDDGTDPVADLMPEDPRIRYFRLDRRRSIGAKRNLACRHAHGALVAHWDDDDWHAPHRLSHQVQALLEAGVDVCGLQTLLFFELAEDVFQGAGVFFIGPRNVCMTGRGQMHFDDTPVWDIKIKEVNELLLAGFFVLYAWSVWRRLRTTPGRS